MSNNKQSSIEWLVNQLQKSKDWQRVLNEVSQMSTARIDIIAQAKAMHKEEIIEAGSDHCYPTCELAKFEAEEYYNEKFGGDND